eukprot:CAMPEP_0197200442 /NCGR_PEP_ID=MMETSP1423-20130617/34398_1 /TAXON_ID=476441 /ORGANISM="Pseudo-nitzschia heimii, Strain UNC1101" /LENGTH=625 /DNA_ID=CAMNT_0042654321 /DNA_START=94 /DNA_END=1974 /DNA_ORIENTATION=-
MASLARPTKRQKQDILSREVFLKPAISAGNSVDCKELFFLIERLASTSQLYSEDFIEIIGAIRSHKYFSKNNDQIAKSKSDNYMANLSIRKLHRTLILHLGFVLGSCAKASSSNVKWEEVLTSIVFCLRDLYISNNGELSTYNPEEGFNEFFILAPNIVLSFSSESCRKMDSVHANVKQKISMACKETIKSWLNTATLLKKALLSGTITALENFLFSLLESRKKTDTGEDYNKLEVLEPLRSLCEDNSNFRRLLDIASLAIQPQLSSAWRSLSPRLLIFYWRCRFYVHGSNSKIEKNVDIAEYALDSMMPFMSSNNHLLSRQALIGIAKYIPIASYDRHVSFMEFATEIFLEVKPHWDERTTENIEIDFAHVKLIQTLECFGLCMKNATSVHYFLQMKDSEKIFFILVQLAVNKKDTNVAEAAAIVLLLFVKEFITAVDHDSPELFRVSIFIVLKLFSSEDTYIVGKTLELMSILFRDLEIRRRTVTSDLSLDLINVLSSTASKNFLVEERAKSNLATSFSILINEIRNVQLLAMEQLNLPFLVQLANGAYIETNRGQVRQISVDVLMKLARNPCNQRILAKEPGLLSSLIQYARIIPEGNEVSTNSSVSKEEMKNRILLLAKSL